MNKLSFKIQDFEGPLDVLLHLINRHKLNINDIPISELVEQYLIYIDSVKESDMDLASEFLEMAARLVYMKTVSLLPVHDDIEVLKKELTGELIEYRDCKAVAQMLKEKADGFDYVLRQPLKFEKDNKYSRIHQAHELLRAYISVVGKSSKNLPPPKDVFGGIVTKKIVSVPSKIIFVLRMLWNKTNVKFSSLFKNSPSRSDMVATFLAVLELVKGNRIKVIDDEDEIQISVLKGEQ